MLPTSKETDNVKDNWGKKFIVAKLHVWRTGRRMVQLSYNLNTEQELDLLLGLLKGF